MTNVLFHVKKSGDNTTLIAILASCGALLAMIIGLAIYASHHRKPYNENQVNKKDIALNYTVSCYISTAMIETGDT